VHTNKNLERAKKVKNDEFFTRLIDIEEELSHYSKDCFKGKTVYCNCDSPESNFVKYFKTNSKRLGISKLLYSGSDFRGDESIKLLKQADVVVTNPPFSLFRPYVAQLLEYEKDFLLIGSIQAITYKGIFPSIRGGKIRIGRTYPKVFTQPDGTLKKFGSICWFTTLEQETQQAKLPLYKKYTPEEYPFYDNYRAINVSKTKEIPMDYSEVMGVPISFLTKFNSDQFEILGCSYTYGDPVGYHTEGTTFDVLIGGKTIYTRLFIRRR